MGKDNFNRIIDSLTVRYTLASRRKVIKPVELCNSVEQKSILVQTNAGCFYTGKQYEKLEEQCFYFIPRGTPFCFRHGKEPYEKLGPEGFTSSSQREEYLKPLKHHEPIEAGSDVFSIIGFEVLIHGAIPFFTILEIPCLMMGKNDTINTLVDRIIEEECYENVGKNCLIRRYTEELIIHICRNIYMNPKLSGNIQKLNYLLDKRLINIIQYIQENLGKDLSNNKIADLAYVSKDYIGQFFKSLTKNNLQDYIENRRLEHAHFLLRTTSDNIQEIAHKVGFKDPAYFSRRFKIRFNQNAKEVRKSDFMVV